MQLFRTVCTTDWKGRPSHSLQLIATSDDYGSLKEQMNKDVRKWQAVEVAGGEMVEDSTIDTVKERVAELIDDPDLAQLWRHDDRFEMRLTDADHREFVDRIPEPTEFTTTVYHFLD